MVYLVTGYIKTKTRFQDGTGSKQHMVYEIWPDEPSADRRAKALVESGPCLWATYERKD